MESLKEISKIIDKVFNAFVEFFQSKYSTKKIFLTTDRATSNSRDTKYLEINNGMIDIKGEFYDSDGVILNEFNKRADIEDLDDIEQTVTSFLNEIKNKYDDILKKFIREYELN